MILAPPRLPFPFADHLTFLALFEFGITSPDSGFSDIQLMKSSRSDSDQTRSAKALNWQVSITVSIDPYLLYWHLLFM